MLLPAAPRSAAVLLLAAAEALSTSTAPRAITGAWPQAFPAKDLCSNCGLCKTDVGIASVTDACAFIGDGMARAESSRSASTAGAAPTMPVIWTRRILGSTTRSCWRAATSVGRSGRGRHRNSFAWLEAGEVDAVVVAGSSEDGFGSPEPVLCKSTEDVLRGRRVKPSLCPSLAILDEVRDDASIKRLLFCGVGCSVQALRGINKGDPASALNLDELPKSTLRLS